jgi:DNA-binding MarR family transcriptional regulator
MPRPAADRDAFDAVLDQWSAERPEMNTASLGVVIRIMGLYRTFLRDATRALEPTGLELWEYDVLSALRRQGRPFELSASRLARETDLSTGAMTNRIDRLERRGLVRRRTDEVDRRAVRVALTREGVAKIDEAVLHRLEAADESLQSLAPDERDMLAVLLRKVVSDTGTRALAPEPSREGAART